MALMKKLTSAIVASSLVLGLAGAAGATTPDKVQTAADRMLKLHMIKGVTPGTTDLALSANLTRAELMTVLVRAFGQESSAKYLEGAAAFPDTANHWGSGYIALAKKIIADRTAGKEVVGMPDGTFNPNGNVTTGEAVAFLMKFVGAPKDDSLAWPDNYIQGAATAGIITAEDKAMLLGSKNDKATRGLAFYLADHTFYGYKLAEGSTVYTTFADSVKPSVTVDATPTTTLKDKIDITGTVPADVVTVHVNTMDNVATVANGKFTASVDLKVGENTILVHAVDLAGNQGEQTVKVTRTVGAADKIDVADITVAAGQAVDVKAVVKDANGNEIKDAVVTGESKIGAFAAGKFTAGKVAGVGSVTLKSGELTKDVKVTVTAGPVAKAAVSKESAAIGEFVVVSAQDEFGNVVPGATFSQSSADASVEQTTGRFIAQKSGVYTVTVKVGDVTKEVKVGVYESTVASYSVKFGASKLVANNATSTTLTIKALDQFGNVIGNYAGNAIVNSPVPFKYNTDGSSTFTNVLNGASVPLKNGVATLTVVTDSGALGGQTAKATVGTGNAASSATIDLADQVATSVSVANPDAFLASNTTANATTFTVKVLDQDGKPMLGGYTPVEVTLNSGVSAQIVNVNNAAVAGTNKYTIYYNGITAQTLQVSPTLVGASGVVTATATAPGLTTGSKSVNMQLAGMAAKLGVTAASTNATAPVAGTDSVAYTIQVQDAAGVPVSASSSTVVVAVTGITNDNRTAVTVNGVNPSADTFQVPVTVTNGTAAVTISATGFAGNLGFVAKDTATSNALAASAASTVNFAAGAVSQVNYKINGQTKTSVDVAAGTDAFQVVAQLRDVNGNPTTNPNATLKATVAASNGGVANDVIVNGTAGVGTATVDEKGQATFTVKAGTFVGGIYTLTFTGTYDSNGLTKNFGENGNATLPAVTTINVKNSVANAVSVAVYTNSDRTTLTNTVTASDTDNAFVTATVTDGAGRKVNSETLTVYTVAADGSATALNPQPAVLANPDGTYTFAVKAQKAPGVTFKITTNSSASSASATFTVGVRPASTPNQVVIAGGATQDIARLTEKAVTISLADTYGNAIVNTNAAQQVALTFGAKNVQVRTTPGGLVATNGTVTIPQGAQSVTVYLVTDELAATTITMTATGTGLAGTPATATLNVK